MRERERCVMCGAIAYRGGALGVYRCVRGHVFRASEWRLLRAELEVLVAECGMRAPELEQDTA